MVGTVGFEPEIGSISNTPRTFANSHLPLYLQPRRTKSLDRH